MNSLVLIMAIALPVLFLFGMLAFIRYRRLQQMQMKSPGIELVPPVEAVAEQKVGAGQDGAEAV